MGSRGAWWWRKGRSLSALNAASGEESRVVEPELGAGRYCARIGVENGSSGRLKLLGVGTEIVRVVSAFVSACPVGSEGAHTTTQHSRSRGKFLSGFASFLLTRRDFDAHAFNLRHVWVEGTPLVRRVPTVRLLPARMAKRGFGLGRLLTRAKKLPQIRQLLLLHRNMSLLLAGLAQVFLFLEVEFRALLGAEDGAAGAGCGAEGELGAELRERFGEEGEADAGAEEELLWFGG